MNKDKTKISVCMCSYNNAAHIGEAIESVLAQTFADFEFIIVDDGSTDGTWEVVRSFKDKRIRAYRLKHDYIRSLNFSLRKCRGTYIARMDNDDVMHPDRLRLQAEVMDKYPETTVCSTWATMFGETQGTLGKGDGPIAEPYWTLALGNFVIHPSSMIRKDFLRQHRIHYKDGYNYAEDYKLWSDIARKGGRFHVIPRPLLEYRISRTQITNLHRSEQEATRLLIEQEIIEDLIRSSRHPIRRRAAGLFRNLSYLNQEGLIGGDAVIGILFRLLANMKAQEKQPKAATDNEDSASKK